MAARARGLAVRPLRAGVPRPRAGALSPTTLGHVVWLGGGSGSGKTTIARRIAAEHGLRVLSTDESMADHAQRSAPREVPYLRRFIAMDMDERWLNRTPQAMLETFPWFRGEGFRLIVEDLRRAGRGSTVVAEGFRLLPGLVRPLLGEPARAVWLLPTARFRREAFARRAGEADFTRRTSDPDRALGNLLARDAMFTDRLRAEAQALGLSTIDVDLGMAEDELAARVWRVFAP